MNNFYWAVYEINKKKQIVIKKKESLSNKNSIISYILELQGDLIISGKNILKNKYNFFNKKNIKIKSSSILLPSAKDMIPLAKQYFYKNQINKNKLLYLGSKYD